MEFKKDQFVFEVISNEEKTVLLKGRAGIWGCFTTYGNPDSLNIADKCVVLPSVVEYEGVEYSVTQVAKDVFHDLEDMVEIQIPASVEFCDWCFYNCVSLQNIKVDAQNPKYMDIDGVMYVKSSNGDALELVAYPTGRVGHYVIPESVKKICSFAFKTSKVKSVEIPQSVTEIGNNVFYRANCVESVVLPDKLRKMGNNEQTTTTFVYKGSTYTGEQITELFRSK